VITPSKILNVFRDETNKTYENKFINTLINRLFWFVEHRYETALKEGKDEKNTSLDYKQDFTHGPIQGKIHFRIEVAEEPKSGEELKNYTYTTEELLSGSIIVGTPKSTPAIANENGTNPPTIGMNAPILSSALKIVMESPLRRPTLKQPIIGDMMLSSREVTRPVNAPPMITPIAISMMFPLVINVLNSSNNFFIFLFLLSFYLNEQPHLVHVIFQAMTVFPDCYHELSFSPAYIQEALFYQAHFRRD
jgi:hypothetical protein